MKEMVETMDAANALTRDVEEATANMQVSSLPTRHHVLPRTDGACFCDQDDLASARTAAGSAAAEQAHHRQPAAEHADNNFFIA